MTEKREKARVRLELTECQKEQIREATGRQVNSLELMLEGLPEAARKSSAADSEQAPEDLPFGLPGSRFSAAGWLLGKPSGA
jgi:hypothetical protein